VSERIDVVPIYLGDRARLLPALAAHLAATFAAEVAVRPPWFDPEAAFDPSRGQYSSTVLLQLLLGDGGPAPRRPPAAGVLGVAGVDLFIPVLTYVFGEAQLPGRAAVVSLHRLRPELYGLAADEPLLADRLAKEAVHELGHTRGLVHCPDPACVMRASTYVEEIDWKGGAFCPDCVRAVAHSSSGTTTTSTLSARSPSERAGSRS
jgi:archaemetzincin